MLQDVEIDCGDDCERFIDGIWYSAKVIELSSDSVSIRYNDDGKAEYDIPMFCDEIRYSKFPECEYVEAEKEMNSGSNVPMTTSSALESNENERKNGDLSCYRLNQLEHIFGRTIVPSCTSSRPALRVRSKSTDSFLRTERTVTVFLCPTAGHLFTYRPVVNQPESCTSIRTYTGSWGKPYTNLLPLADLCVACRRYTIYKCGRCNEAFYCSKSCQKNNWAHHKVFCDPKPLLVLFRPNPKLLPATRPKQVSRVSNQCTTPTNSGFRTPDRNNKTDRYSGRNEATDAAFGREGGATRRLWDKSVSTSATTTTLGPVPLFDIRTSNAPIATITPSSSSSGSHINHFHKISEAADDVEEQSGIHGHLRGTLSSQSRSSHASRETQPEQWDYATTYQRGIMSSGLAEEYGYGTSGALGGGAGGTAVAAVAVSPLTVPPHYGGRTAGYEPLHRISAHSSSNSMVTQDVVSHSGSPALGLEVYDVPDSEEDMEKFRRAVTPTQHHLRSLDTLNINGFRHPSSGGNPFVVNHRPGGVVSEEDYAMEDDDDDDDMPSLAAVAPAPASLAPREGGGSPVYARPYNGSSVNGSTKSVTISATNTTPIRSTATRPIEVIDLELEDQIKTLVMELGVNEKSLRLGLKLFNNDLDRAVEWVFEGGNDFELDGQWV